MIELKNISKVYVMGEGEQVVRALDKINLTIKDGEYIAIIGPSGSGKSTLMNVLGCLDNPSKGQYLLNGKDVSKLRDDQLADVRNRNIGFVFQRFNLMGRMSAIRNVEMPARYGGVSSRERHKRAVAALSSVGLAKRMNHTPVELSGGQQQRVAIARALVNQPNILLADEPTGALDSKTGRDILNLFERLHKERGITIIVVTHDPNIARRAERVVSIRDGRIESDTLTADMPVVAAVAAPVLAPMQVGDGAEVRRLAALNHLGALNAGGPQGNALHLNHAELGDHHDLHDHENDVENETPEQDQPKPTIRLAGRDVLKRGLIAIFIAGIVNVGLGLLITQLITTASRLPFFAPIPVAVMTVLFGLIAWGVFALLNQKAQQPMRLFKIVAALALLLSFAPNVVAMSNPSVIAPVIALERQLSGQSAVRTGFNRQNAQFGQGGQAGTGQGQTDPQAAGAGATAGTGANANRQGQAGGGGFRGGGPFGALFGSNTGSGRTTGTNLTFPLILLMVLHVVAYSVITGVLTRKPSLRAIDLDID